MHQSLLLILLGTLALSACHSGSDAKPWPDTQEGLHKVTLDSNPRGALVLRNDDILCRSTPCTRALPAGEHKISMHVERHAPHEETVKLGEDTTFSWELTPDFARLTLNFEGQPGKVRVEIDGEDKGSLPMEGLELKPGSHKLSFHGPCHRSQEQELTVKRGQEVTLQVKPEPKTAEVTITAQNLKGKDIQAQVSLDGNALGQAPGTFTIPICTGLLVVSSAEHGMYSTQIQLQDEQSHNLRALLGQGTLPIAGVDFALVQPGSFRMGSPTLEAGRDSDETPHEVIITRPFLLQTTEVTQAQWEGLMGNKPSHHTGCPTCPVEQVSWWGALTYLNALSRQQGLESCYELKGCTGQAGNNYSCKDLKYKGFSCKGYRLPTEGEWEYAARAGTTGARHGVLREVAWFNLNAKGATHPVGGLKPNAWGLHDMLGNVYEWTWDVTGSYPNTKVVDPEGPSTHGDHVIRGGCWQYDARRIRSAYRDSGGPALTNNRLGFRAARTMAY